MGESIWIRGEGGGIHRVPLPLPEGFASRLQRGVIVRVNEDGTPYTEPSDVPAPATVRPAVNASKAEWVGWAVHNGANPELASAATKQDLIEKYGAFARE